MTPPFDKGGWLRLALIYTSVDKIKNRFSSGILMFSACICEANAKGGRGLSRGRKSAVNCKQALSVRFFLNLQLMQAILPLDLFSLVTFFFNKKKVTYITIPTVTATYITVDTSSGRRQAPPLRDSLSF